MFTCVPIIPPTRPTTTTPATTTTTAPPSTTAATLPPPPEPEAKCSFYGWRLIESFDGSVYDFRDACSHVLAKDVNDNWVIEGEREITLDCGVHRLTRKLFTYIRIVRRICKTPRQKCRSQILISQGITTVTVDLTKTSRQIGYRGQKFSPRMMASALGGQELVISKVGMNVFIESTLFGFHLAWIPSRAEIGLWVGESLKSSVVGLCGFYNGDPDDDKWTADGRVVDSVEEFAESWRLDGVAQADCSPRPPAIKKCSDRSVQEAKRICEEIYQ